MREKFKGKESPNDRIRSKVTDKVTDYSESEADGHSIPGV
jgi:hypothetical protein